MSRIKKTHIHKKSRLNPAVNIEPMSEYKNSLQNLSYKQLLRIYSSVSAKSDAEKEASKRFYINLTPPEYTVAKSIREETNPETKKRKMKSLAEQLYEKNRTETLGVDISALIKEAKGNNLL